MKKLFMAFCVLISAAVICGYYSETSTEVSWALDASEVKASASAAIEEDEDLDLSDELEEFESEKTVLKAGFFTDDVRTRAIERLVAQFEQKNPDIDVQLQMDAYTGFFQKIRTQLAGGSAPDVWYTDGVYLFEWSERDVLKDLTEWFKRDFKESDYYAMNHVKDREGRVWSVPHEFLTFGLYYNKDIFDKCNVEYPSKEPTWDEILDKAIKTTRDFDNDGITDTFGYEGHAGFANFIYQHGITFLDETKQKSLMNTEPFIAAVGEWYDMLHKYKVLPTAEITESYGGGSTELFLQGKLSMWLGTFQTCERIRLEKPGMRFGVVMPPKKVTRTCYYDTNCFVITKSAPITKQKAAWKLIKFFMKYDNQVYWSKKVGLLPCLKKAAQDIIAGHQGQPENIRAFLDSVPYLIPYDVNGCWNEWIGALFEPMGKLQLEGQRSKAGFHSGNLLNTRCRRHARCLFREMPESAAKRVSLSICLSDKGI